STNTVEEHEGLIASPQSVVFDKNKNIWFGESDYTTSPYRVNKLDISTREIESYTINAAIVAPFISQDGNIWLAANNYTAKVYKVHAIDIISGDITEYPFQAPVSNPVAGPGNSVWVA